MGMTYLFCTCFCIGFVFFFCWVGLQFKRHGVIEHWATTALKINTEQYFFSLSLLQVNDFGTTLLQHS